MSRWHYGAMLFLVLFLLGMSLGGVNCIGITSEEGEGEGAAEGQAATEAEAAPEGEGSFEAELTPEGEAEEGEHTADGEAAGEGEATQDGEAGEGEHTLDGEAGGEGEIAPEAEVTPEGEAGEGEHTADGEAGDEGEAVSEGEETPDGESTVEGETASNAYCKADCTYDVLHVYPHDSEAFTQGLVYVDGALYEGTGLRGESSLRRVDLESGTVLQRHDLSSQYFGEGITILDGRIYQLTWQANKGFVYDRDTFGFIEAFTYPTEGWGLTHDGAQLIMSDGTDTLYFFDPIALTRIGSVQVWDADGPVTRLNELEWVHGEVLANVWYQDYLVRIDPATGRVLGKIYLDGLLTAEDSAANPDVLNGIAYDADGDRLFVTGKRWPKLFEIRLAPHYGVKVHP